MNTTTTRPTFYGWRHPQESCGRFEPGCTSEPPCIGCRHGLSGAIESLVIQYAADMMLDVKVGDDASSTPGAHFDTTQLVELTSADCHLQHGGAFFGGAGRVARRS